MSLYTPRGDTDAPTGASDSVVRLVASAERRDGLLLWPQAGRYSAAVQGESAAALAAEYLRTGEPLRAEQARAAIAPLLEPDAAPGLVSVIADGPVLEDGGAEPGMVLSGWLRALGGVREVALALGDDEARALYERSVAALAATLPYYDMGWWTRRSLGAGGWDIATPAEHALHSAQIAAMAEHTGRCEFARAARRWRRYDTPLHRARARLLRARVGRGRTPPGRPPATGPSRVRMAVHGPYPICEPRGERAALALRDAGLDVEVVCMRLPGEPAGESAAGVSVIRMPMEHRRGASALAILGEYAAFTVRAAIALARRGPDTRPELVYVHAPPDFLQAASLLPRLRGARSMLDIHDLSPDMFDARYSGGLAARAGTALLRAIERIACATADCVVTVHQPYADELARNGVRRDKIAVVMNALDERLRDSLPGNSSSAGPERTFTVAYHGTITSWYGLDLLVEALAIARVDVPGIRAIVVGEGDALEETRRRARQLGVEDRVEFTGSVPLREALARVAVADCGVVPNKPTKLNRFALSSKLFEYVELGIPVAVARLETLALHFDDDEVAFFTPGDAASLARAIVSIARDPERARERAARARDRVRQEYSWKRSRERLLERTFALVPEPPSASWRPAWWGAGRT